MVAVLAHTPYHSASAPHSASFLGESNHISVLYRVYLLRSSSGLRYNEPSYKLRDYIQLSVYGSHCSIALDEHSTTSKF